jgi:nucleoside-diphosphate-sugar epimerase
VDINPDPDIVIPTVVNSTLNALKAAANESSVKRFVLTSSGSAVVFPKPNHKINITPDTWNEESVQIVQNFPNDLSDVQKGFIVYMASKVKGEQALWNWVKENQSSHLVVNSGTFCC